METMAQKQFWLQQQFNGAVAFIVLTILFVALMLLSTAIRVQKRVALLRADIWQDILIISSLFAILAMCVCAIINEKAYEAYYKSHTKAEKTVHWIQIYKSVYGFSVIYPVASVLPKLSLCILYLRLFEIHPWLRRMTYGMSAFLVANAIAWLVPSIVVCWPISAYWEPSGHRGQCLDNAALGTWISLPNILSDILMLVFPIPILWKLSMSWLKRFGLIFTFVAASIGVVGACCRLSFYIKADYVKKKTEDVTTRTIALSVIFTYLECGMYLIAATMPSMRVVFQQLRDVIYTGLAKFSRKECKHSSDFADPTSSGSPPNCRCGRQHLDVKLTGIGDLETLKQKGDAIGG